MFSEDRFISRFIIFISAVGLVVAICLFHGFFDKERTTRFIDEMIKNRQLIGKFWRIVECRENHFVVSKFNRTIILTHSARENCRAGDNISFIAQKEEMENGTIDSWCPIKVHFHGTSSFKFWISAVAVLLVMLKCFKDLGFDRHSFSLTFKDERSSCLMD